MKMLTGNLRVGRCAVVACNCLVRRRRAPRAAVIIARYDELVEGAVWFTIVERCAKGAL